MAVVYRRRRHKGQPQVEFGLGLHVGEVTHANVGSPERLAFNVVGPPVNTTARIQSMTKETGVPLLLSSDFAKLVRQTKKGPEREWKDQARVFLNFIKLLLKLYNGSRSPVS